MTQTTHTPGPWWLDFGRHDAAIHAGGTIAMIDDAMTAWEANARLIAAAPDLLAALEDMLDLMGPLSDVALIRRKQVARAAIAKAKGE